MKRLKLKNQKESPLWHLKIKELTGHSIEAKGREEVNTKKTAFGVNGQWPYWVFLKNLLKFKDKIKIDEYRY